MEILSDFQGQTLWNAKHRNLIHSLAENYVVEALGGKPPRIIEAVEYQEAVKTDGP